MFTQIRLIVFGIVGTIILGMGIAIWWLNWSLDDARATVKARDDEIAALRREAAVQATITDIRADILNAVQKAAADAEERARRTAERISEIDQAPATDDGPVAPVLNRTLDSFRRGR